MRKEKKRTPAWYMHAAFFRIGNLIYPRFKRRKIILFRYTRALGDNLMLTTIAREVKKRNPGAVIHVISGLPEIFDRNPDVHSVIEEPETHPPGLGKYLIHYESTFPWKRHFLELCCEFVDIKDHIDLKTYIYPSDEHRNWATDILQKLSQERPILVNRSAGPRTDKKNWPYAHWQSLTDKLMSKAPVIDIGLDITEQLENISLDLKGNTGIHQLAALMEQSAALISPDTGTVHLASASALPTVCIIGGHIPRISVGYPNCTVMANLPECKYCWEQGACGHDFKCLKDISPHEVYRAFMELPAHRQSVTSPGQSN